MHRPPRGVTLIELLVVVAIIGLIVAAILVGLFPSDDRRVKGEAERLAAYLEAAGAQAKMNEGPVRVQLALTDGGYHRQAAKVGAKLAERLWKDDDSARPDRVKAPVQLAAVLMGGAVEMTSGTAWLLWEDTRTAGASLCFSSTRPSGPSWSIRPQAPSRSSVVARPCPRRRSLCAARCVQMSRLRWVATARRRPP
jgi:general secretion pathway protein H